MGNLFKSRKLTIAGSKAGPCYEVMEGGEAYNVGRMQEESSKKGRGRGKGKGNKKRRGKKEEEDEEEEEEQEGEDGKVF